jgi:putative PEP-CTERM system histidine kinase
MLIDIIQKISAVLGILTACAVLLYRRFGSASWLLCVFLICSAALPGFCILMADTADPDLLFRLAISFLLLAAPLGLLFTWAIDQNGSWQSPSVKRRLISVTLFPVPVLLISLYFIPPTVGAITSLKGMVALGPGGYLSSLYLLITAVVALSRLEQIIRTVEEKIKWQIKFLVLGLAANYASIIYLASKTLLYSFRSAFLPKDALDVFILVFPVSCILILASWRRSFGNSKIVVSQSLVFSSITLLCVGTYLIASALIARWISLRVDLGVPLEAALFLLSIIAFATILLWTSFRHRVRDWIRRNVFRGRYDYRQVWMEATAEIRSVDGTEKTALALASLIQRTLGAIEIGIWLRDREREEILLIAGLGEIVDIQGKEVKGILERLASSADPVRVEDIEKIDENTTVKAFFESTKAAIIVPLTSSGRLVGLLTVGSDRSGRTYNWEAREFLRVIANHAAGEFHKQELLASLMEAKESEAFKSFSTFLLHDLKNFASTLSLIARNAGRHQNNPEFQKDAFQSIFETAEKMKRLCNNLRTFSSNLAANRRACDLNKLIHSAVESLNSGLPQQINLELGELQPVFIDPDEVTRVFQNLLLNAREAISSNGSITVQTDQQNGNAHITVSDDGKGMTKKFLEKELFLPFHTTKSDGLGIGLFQCKKIIEAHEGHIDIESKEGAGTVVTIKLPVAARA